MSAADRWASALHGWKIPDSILAQAPESPWGFPPALFGSGGGSFGALHRTAQAALEGHGSVLDVGCGGGAASVPLVPPATKLVGVDNLPEMLEKFAGAAESTGAAHTEILGIWPDVADQVPRCDVAVCRNVAYNVATIVPFLTALTGHASKRVVVELTASHPSVPLAPLWMRFWGLARPDGPTSGMFGEVLHEIGINADVVHETRPSVKGVMDAGEYVAFVRRRLCLDPSHDPEIAAELEELDVPFRDETTAAVFSWEP
ncbi:MAG TPA: methyltransferase domain-containing protein [Acidimicrobiales bacterium]